MRRIVLASAFTAMLGLIAAPAQAEQVTHDQSTFSVEFTSPAGTLCNFNEKEIYRISDNALIFGDPDDPDKTIDEFNIEATHINLDSGYTLTEADQYVVAFDASDAKLKVVGLFWHLRDSTGTLVLVEAGVVIVDTDTGEVVKVVPNLNPDFGEVLCPALGGTTAS